PCGLEDAARSDGQLHHPIAGGATTRFRLRSLGDRLWFRRGHAARPRQNGDAARYSRVRHPLDHHGTRRLATWWYVPNRFRRSTGDVRAVNDHMAPPWRAELDRHVLDLSRVDPGAPDLRLEPLVRSSRHGRAGANRGHRHLCLPRSARRQSDLRPYPRRRGGSELDRTTSRVTGDGSRVTGISCYLSPVTYHPSPDLSPVTLPPRVPNQRLPLSHILPQRPPSRRRQRVLRAGHPSFERLPAREIPGVLQLARVDAHVAVRRLENRLELVEAQ